MTKRASIAITPKEVAELLGIEQGFPGYHLRSSYYDFDSDMFLIGIGHSDLEEVEEGCQAPRLRWGEDWS